MIDFDRLDAELDAAGCDQEKLSQATAVVVAELWGMPEGERTIAVNRLLEICGRRTEAAKKAIEAAIASGV
jgi:hypothetical protein